jgi:hypothetical protein
MEFPMVVQLWSLAAAAMLVLLFTFRALGRNSRTRDAVMLEMRRALRDGAIERNGPSGPKVRGRLGELEVTVDLHTDATRPLQSPMWRILAVGPIPLDQPVEARVAGWQGWIDPWLELGETIAVPGTSGPAFTLNAEHAITLEHPLVSALQRPGIGPGAMHARADLVRVECVFRGRPEENRALFAYLHATAELSERPRNRANRVSSPRHAPSIHVIPRVGV